MEPWEGLDVDDSDLPSLLRPCKRLHRRQNPISITTTGFSLSQPALAPCHNSSQTLLEKEAGEDAQQDVESLRSDSHHKSEQRRLIPGPAGAVQAAMLQKTIDRQNHDFSSSQSANPIATQEYIRRAVEDAPEFDDDFSSNPWISALHYIGRRDGVLPSVPLSSIKECKIVGKADLVVAVIKSCTQNNLGGMMVILKDPTGTIGASVHHKVLINSNFGKDFSVGSVLLLQKVAIFSPSKSVHYLNIMLRNVVKVFSKDIGPPSQHNDLAHLIKYAAPVCSDRACSLEKMLTPEQGTCEEVMDEMRKYTNREASSKYNNQIEEEVLHPQSSKRSTRSSCNENAAVDNDCRILKQDSAEGLSEAIFTKKTADDKREFPEDNDGRQKVCNPQDSLTSNAVTTNQIGQEIQGGNIVQNQNQQLLAAVSLPQWTDEQLAELFAGDDEPLSKGALGKSRPRAIAVKSHEGISHPRQAMGDRLMSTGGGSNPD